MWRFTDTVNRLLEYDWYLSLHLLILPKCVCNLMRKGNHARIIMLYDGEYLQWSIAKVKLQCQET